MDIHLIDEFRRRTNASYDEARHYLEMYNGDLLEAIIAFEREHTGYGGQRRTRPHSNEFLNGIIRAVQALFDIKIIITDRSRKTYPIPIIIPLLLFPAWHIMIAVAVVMYFIGFRFNIHRAPDTNINIESIVNRIRNKINENKNC